MAKTTRKTKQTAVVFNMSATAAADLMVGNEDAILAAMLGEGDTVPPAVDEDAELAALLGDDDELASLDLGIEDETIGDEPMSAKPDEITDEDTILAIAAKMEAAEGSVEEPAIDEPAAEEPTPPVEAADEPAAEEPTAPVKKEKVKKEPKPAAAPRITYVGHTKSEVLKARLGDKASEILLLEVADAALDPEALAAKQEVLLDDIDHLAKKVGEKANMLFAFIKNGGALNEVMARAFKVLAKEGKLTSGDKGNLQTNLREKYSLRTARSQANQMFMLFPALSITKKVKGEMEANPDSLILMKVKADLGLTN